MPNDTTDSNTTSSPSTVGVNLQIPEDLHMDLKLKATKEKVKLEVIVTDALQAYLRPKKGTRNAAA